MWRFAGADCRASAAWTEINADVDRDGLKIRLSRTRRGVLDRYGSHSRAPVHSDREKGATRYIHTVAISVDVWSNATRPGCDDETSCKCRLRFISRISEFRNGSVAFNACVSFRGSDRVMSATPTIDPVSFYFPHCPTPCRPSCKRILMRVIRDNFMFARYAMDTELLFY